MEVATLQPYDCLKRHPHHHNNHRRQLLSQAVKPNPNPNRSNRRRRNSPPPSNGSAKTGQTHQARPKSPPSLGQVRILKRGEEISLPNPPPAKKAEPEFRSFSGPILDGFYAGSAFVTSPPPSELPLPAFFTRRNCGEAHNREIACELRRVLKLQC